MSLLNTQEEAERLLMRGQYDNPPRNVEYNPAKMQTGQFSIAPSYLQRLKSALEEGLLIFTKYALVLILAYLALQFGTGVVSGSTNGTQAALYLNELQNKGWLPKVVNGVIPQKPEAENAKTP